MNELEETLRAALGHAAELAPRPESSLGAEVETRFRRRRHRRHALAAAAAVVVLAAGVTYAARDARPLTVRPATPAGIQPAGKVWPQAIRRIPQTTPDGKQVFQTVGTDGEDLILTTLREAGKAGGYIGGADAIYAYDGSTTRLISRVPGREVGQRVAVGDGHVAWITMSGRDTITVWAAPLSGGTAAAVTTAKLGELDDLAIVGERIVLSRWKGGVYSVPLSGGDPTLIATGMHLLSWPWVGTRTNTKGKPFEYFTRIRNVETGDTDNALVRQGEKDLDCGLTLCTGKDSRGNSFYRKRDGSQQRPHPAWDSTIMWGRFAVAEVPGSHNRAALMDLASGRMGEITFRITDAPPHRARLMTSAWKGQAYVIDLSKIP
ncbi:hypothetical protein ACIBHX_32275 [Nonomuraea sp. NPDC050536]|uniref:hypothetical protein n=1 Tax=Nonomuraea sp. NPDC050536 TaxID=3364366 RepID=UPI0037C5737E